MNQNYSVLGYQAPWRCLRSKFNYQTKGSFASEESCSCRPPKILLAAFALLTNLDTLSVPRTGLKSMFYQNFRWVPQAPNKVSKISNSNIPYSNALRSGAPNGALKTKSSVAAAEAKLPCGAPGGALKAMPSVLTVPSGMKTFAFRTNKVQNL